MLACMRSLAVFSAVLLSIAAPSLAQITITMSGDQPTLLKLNAPFLAERVTTTERTLADGSTIHREAHETISRDEAGRVFADIQLDDTATHQFTLVDLPQQRYYTWSTETMKAWYAPLAHNAALQLNPLYQRPGPSEFPVKQTMTTTEALGSRTIEGVPATGTRTTTTLPAGKVGNSAPLVHREEVWVADDLGLVVEETDFNSYTGKRTVRLVRLERKPQPAERFVLPAGVTAQQRMLPSLGNLLQKPPAAVTPGATPN